MNCKDENSHWRLAINKIGQLVAFKETTYHEHHSCSHILKDQRDKHSTYKYVAYNIKEFYQYPSRKLNSKEIICDIKRKIGVKITSERVIMQKKSTKASTRRS